MAKKSKSTPQAEAGDAAVIEGKKPSMSFVGKRMSQKQFKQLLALTTDPLSRGALRRLFFNRDRNQEIQSYFRAEEDEKPNRQLARN